MKQIFSKIIEETKSTKRRYPNILKAACLDSPLGPIIAISDDQALYLLEFFGRKGLERGVERLRNRTQSNITPGMTSIIHSIEEELHHYFEGKLRKFKTPLVYQGSLFQKTVWEALKKIPLGKTQSYADIAKAIGKPTAFRAVANANGANQLAIIIPCHRVINSNGALGGYGGGLSRKEWLLHHEKRL